VGENLKKKKLIRKTHKHHLKMKWLIVVGLVILVSGGGTFAYYELFVKKTVVPTTSELSSTEKASQLATNGDYAAGQKVLDEELASQTDDAGKVNAYVNKALLAINNKEYADAVNFANKAESIAKSRLTSRLLAQIYELMSDKENSVKYYQLTVDRYSETEKASDELSFAYNEDVQALQELSK